MRMRVQTELKHRPSQFQTMPYTLRVQASCDSLVTIRDFVSETATALGMQIDFVESLLLAADELATNIIEHGYQYEPGEIEIQIELANDSLKMRLIDQAPEFDPTGLPNPDVTLPLDERPIGGLGVYLSRMSVKSINYERTSDGKNILTVTQPLHP